MRVGGDCTGINTYRPAVPQSEVTDESGLRNSQGLLFISLGSGHVNHVLLVCWDLDFIIFVAHIFVLSHCQYECFAGTNPTGITEVIIYVGCFDIVSVSRRHQAESVSWLA